MNKKLVAAAVVTGILCGAWAGLAGYANLSVWIGFAACTAYFACGRSRMSEALPMTLATVLVGVLTAFLMLWGSAPIGGNVGTGLAVGVVVGLIVLMGAVKWLAFVPGIFVGCYSTFGYLAVVENGDWTGAHLWTLLGSLVAGALLGLACAELGRLAGERLVGPEPVLEEITVP
ncbi:uncharacterized protein DUF1097 [Salana multivorans]|uniref:Uncharacterized protein DUF1097 n=1 Tax=Salana multivorans TaxID=120377 RepID=A0A3N2DAZ2_9MICO|nr:DUF1097 domain-containing protein [Salana multivorans]ROR96614.1 uncharacterized protein DUF1097 [Salana multivorans]